MKQRWWEIYPERLKFEMEELAEMGASFKLDETLFERGFAVLKGEYPFETEKIYLEIVYPELYPYFRFEVFAPKLNLRYHQNPFRKNLCLLDRSTLEWDYRDTPARLLKLQLPTIFKANQLNTREDVIEFEKSVGYKIETRDPEPVERFIPYRPPDYIIVDSGWKYQGTSGSLIIGFKLTAQNGGFPGAVLEVRDQQGNILYSADPSMASLYPHWVKGKWQFVDKPIVEGDPKLYLQELVKYNSMISQTTLTSIKNIKKDEALKNHEVGIDIVASVYQDETSHRSKDGPMSWVFIGRLRGLIVNKKGKVKVSHEFFLQTRRGGRTDVASRVPEFKGLSSKKIALFGLGCLGSQCAVEFAKAGMGTLSVLDHDSVGPENSVRWLMGFSSIGKPKAFAMRDWASLNYPYTRVQPFVMRLGAAIIPDLNEPSQTDVMNQMLEDADIVVDATADAGIQDYLSKVAQEKEIPYIFMSTTPGTRGGMIARFRPGKTAGCCECLRNSIAEKKVPIANSDKETGEIIPAGCSEPTFTGNNFDAMQTVIAGVRMTISTLMEGTHGGYPSIPWDLEVINIRNEAGEIIPIQTFNMTIERHSACQRHHSV